MYILSTFADRAYWPSSLEPLLYPTGCSFYRPFSYLETYVTPTLLEVLKDPKQLDKFLTDENRNRGVFGMRFRGKEARGSEDIDNDESTESSKSAEGEDKYGKIFIPLRWVKLTDVQIKDSVQLSFTLGEYISLKDEKFQPISLDGIIDFTKSETMLMIEISSEKMKDFSSTFEPPNHLWKSLATDESLPPKAKENFRGAIVLRLIQVTERGSLNPLTPKSLETGRKDQVFGFALKSEKVYDFDLIYNRIFGPGESDAQFAYDYTFRGPAEQFVISRDELPITGNYRLESVWVQPKLAQPASVLLEWDGVKRSDKNAITDPRIDKILPLRVPVISSARFWSRQRIIDGAITLLSLILTGISLYFAYKWSAPATASPGAPQGTQTASSLAPIFMAAAALFAGLFSSNLKDFIKGRS